MSKNFYTVLSDDEKNEINERFDLVFARVAEIRNEALLPEALRDYTAAVSDCFMALKDASYDGFYGRFASAVYEESFLNPAYAVLRLQDAGGLLSAVYGDIASLMPYAVLGRKDVITIFAELFVELYGIMSIGITEGDLPEDGAPVSEETLHSLKDAVYWFYHDYSEIFAEESILSTIDPSFNDIYDIVMKADLSDLSYLKRYGLYISENETGSASFLNSLSDEEIRAMARTFTEGYRIGFEVTRRDLSRKKTVKIEYPVGFERMVREAVKNFEAMGLSVTFSMEALLSLQGRGGEKRGTYSSSANRQFDFDHKDDKGYYFDKGFISRRLEVIKDTYEKNRDLARQYGGPAVIEVFGEEDFSPVNKPEAYEYTKEQNQLQVTFASKAGEITNTYIPGDERSFTIISYPYPSIGKDYEAIFRETVKINTLDYVLYRGMQQKIIDALDLGAYVKVIGSGDNRTNMVVQLHPLSDPAKETIFENCVADVNIPVGEVFTSPVLTGTHGTLHVSQVYLGIYQYKDLELTFEDGIITDYTCENFKDEEENKKLIYDNILYHHDFLPIGEFAIGTNTAAFVMARKYGIQSKLPILIAEKTGPHFAVGDTCYDHAEEVPMYNPDGKEVVARSNEYADLRDTAPEKAYFNCHTDITIPYDELQQITVVHSDGTEVDIIRNGRFVLEGTEKLNEALIDFYGK